MAKDTDKAVTTEKVEDVQPEEAYTVETLKAKAVEDFGKIKSQRIVARENYVESKFPKKAEDIPAFVGEFCHTDALHRKWERLLNQVVK